MLIRQKESDVLTKLATMLRAEERRPEGERDHKLIATINRTIDDLKRQMKERERHSRLPRWDFANAVSGNGKCFVVAVEKDRDKLVSKLERAVDKGNAAALVSFLVFDAVANVKFRSGHFRCSVVEAPAWNRRSLVC
jgi:hypothetical protein